MRKSNAWLLNLGSDRSVALGEREVLHLLPEPQLFDVPLAPDYCAQVLRWQDQLLPVWDLRVWLGDHSEHPELVAIVGYQRHVRQTPLFGALLLAEPPVRLQVSDELACGLPEGIPWPDIACSCFLHGQGPVPILDLNKMFSGINT